MGTLLLKFEIDLDRDILPRRLHSGPRFHRWLPDGEKDAIALDTCDPHADLKVWFERRGYVELDSIRYDYERREVDPDILATEGLVSGGPLLGLLRLTGLSEEQLAGMRENGRGDAGYIALGKRVVKKLLYPPVSRFVEILRVNYGQHWIRELQKWDSRVRNLGNYCCKVLRLEWSLDEGKTWQEFLPDEPARRAAIVVPRYSDYLTKEDWQQLAELAQVAYEPSLAASLLARTHQFLDEGNLKHALIEGVSALEVGLGEFIAQKLTGADALRDAMQAFWNSSLRSRVVVVASVSGKVPLADIEHTVHAIKARNDVVHEGREPPDDARDHVSGLLNTVGALLSGPGFKFPTRSSVGMKAAPETWEKLDEAAAGTEAPDETEV
ncbi:MAG: hypothetical protein WBB22_05770 [Anaerolineae bacterium]